jgi:UDP-N-acetylmuramate--alanine ligase
MRIYFIGIGGIGISALVRYYLSEQNNVAGSDLTRNEITSGLEKDGVTIYLGQHDAERINQNIDLVIYSAAIKNDNKELKKARALGIKTLKYSEALGNLTKKYFTICVAGTHGKSTTTAMLALLLIEAGLDPTVVVGTKLTEFNNTNFRKGSDNIPEGFSQPLLLVEADEWQASFLNYHPDIILINNIEEEHLDFYKGLLDIINTFIKFVHRLPENGFLVLNEDDKNIRLLRNKLEKKITTYTYSQEDSVFNKLLSIVQVPGEHNVYNALAALTVGKCLGIKENIIFTALRKYHGAWRRYETSKLKINQTQQVTIINDYAHHPTEIKATLSGIRGQYPKEEILVVFQPHQKQRTYHLFDQFVKAFNNADRLILLDIYEVEGRETKNYKVSSQQLAEKIKEFWENQGIKNQIQYCKNQIDAVYFIKNHCNHIKILVIMGAGDIYKMNRLLKKFF